ncbi:MAG: hypothetical protein JW946_05730, partial [Candidatus Omnitrophica bacterium]|nr:hypothetical protein [Candidatus Omnitrophota bacterium]
MDKQVPKLRISNTGICILFLIVVPAAAHLLFSYMGFNLTDDGVLLAGCRRILEGEIPHRDFISIRPAGSYILHLPFVFFDQEYTFWISRLFVWFQLACIAWCWVEIIGRLLRFSFSAIEKVS